jgi:hypothetical protein
MAFTILSVLLSACSAMFKLTELFVEIKGQDDPLRASIEKLKGSMSVMAGSLGSTIGSAFGVALGPINLIFKAIEGLLSLVDTSSESVGQLGEYWQATWGPIKEVLTGAVNAAADWVAGLAKMIKENEAVVDALALLDEYSAAAFENIKTAIDRGVEVFEQFKAAAIETGQGVVIILGQVYESIQKSFGGEATASVVLWGETLKTWVLDKAELVGIVVRNWPEFFQIAGLEIKQVFVNIGEYMGTIPANARIIGEYLANNWVRLIVDSGNAIGTAFMNLGTNLKNIWQAFLDYLKTGKFEVDFKPLLEGFVATADKLPALVKPALTSYEDQIKALQDRIGAREVAGFAKHAKAKKDAEAEAAAAGSEKSPFKSQSFGLTDFANKIRSDIFNAGKGGDVAEKTLTATERTAKATEEIAEEAKKPKPARAG